MCKREGSGGKETENVDLSELYELPCIWIIDRLLRVCLDDWQTGRLLGGLKGKRGVGGGGFFSFFRTQCPCSERGIKTPNVPQELCNSLAIFLLLSDSTAAMSSEIALFDRRGSVRSYHIQRAPALVGKHLLCLGTTDVCVIWHVFLCHVFYYPSWFKTALEPSRKNSQATVTIKIIRLLLCFAGYLSEGLWTRATLTLSMLCHFLEFNVNLNSSSAAQCI